MPLAQVASVSAPQPRLRVVQPWDKAAADPILKGIQSADLGLNPSRDGDLIRVPIPALTEERRHELVKRCKKMAEELKVSVRNIRRDANELLERNEGEGLITEDDLRRGQKEIQKVTDAHIELIDAALVAKEKEILEG
jgi:ribosome recycling factor